VLDFTAHWAGISAIIIFALAYSLVIAEESIHLRKSKPVMVAAGIIWAIVAIAYASHGDTHTAGQAVRHNLLEFAELFLFLLAAMTYINAMDERGVFDVLRVWLVSRGFSLRGVFWITGLLAGVFQRTFTTSPPFTNSTKTRYLQLSGNILALPLRYDHRVMSWSVLPVTFPLS
jgi:Na+/H+ antiporter NhaD/arsenite permease-like protein